MQILLVIAIALTAAAIVLVYRRKRDRELILSQLSGRSALAPELRRVKKGHPFSDTGRGWWAWRVRWQDGSGTHTSWVLTTRDGIKEWRD